MSDLATLAAAVASPPLHAVPPHPNDIDRKRIERALDERARYRYVRPEVRTIEDGYLVTSPCCSRNIDASGSAIDIARLIHNRLGSNWSLQYRDHAAGCWIQHSEHASLTAALAPLVADPARRFWP